MAGRSTTRGIWTGIVVIAVVVGAVWVLVSLIGLQASLIWTSVLGAMAWAVQSAVQQRQEYQRLLADQKREQYFEFLEILSQFLPGSVGADLGQSPELLAQLRRWSLRLTLIGSDEVVTTFNRARRVDSPQTPSGGVEMLSPETLRSLRAWGVLWLAMRKDCGHFDTKLQVADMLASVVNDIDVYRSQLS